MASPNHSSSGLFTRRIAIAFESSALKPMGGSSHRVCGCVAAMAGSGNLRCLPSPSSCKVQLVLGLGMLKDR